MQLAVFGQPHMDLEESIMMTVRTTMLLDNV